jgi:hypothetical protein
MAHAPDKFISIERDYERPLSLFLDVITCQVSLERAEMSVLDNSTNNMKLKWIVPEIRCQQKSREHRTTPMNAASSSFLEFMQCPPFLALLVNLLVSLFIEYL